MAKGGRACRARQAGLLSGSPREVLARIVPGDPLGLRALAARRLRERALLVDGDRLHLRALARCAHAGSRLRGPLGPWLEGRVDESIDELLAEGSRALPPPAARAPAAPPAKGADASAPAGGRVGERTPPGAGPGSPAAGSVADLARRLGLDVAAARGACAAFNALPADDREAFFRLVIEGESLDELARTAPVSAPEWARRARRGLAALVAVDVPPPAARDPRDPRPSGPRGRR